MISMKEISKKNLKKSVVIEMPAEIYKYVKENKSRIFVGYQRCKIFDLISVKPIIGQDTDIVEQRVKTLQCTQNARCHTWQAYAAKL